MSSYTATVSILRGRVVDIGGCVGPMRVSKLLDDAALCNDIFPFGMHAYFVQTAEILQSRADWFQDRFRWHYLYLLHMCHFRLYPSEAVYLPVLLPRS